MVYGVFSGYADVTHQNCYSDRIWREVLKNIFIKRSASHVAEIMAEIHDQCEDIPSELYLNGFPLVAEQIFSHLTPNELCR